MPVINGRFAHIWASTVPSHDNCYHLQVSGDRWSCWNCSVHTICWSHRFVYCFDMLAIHGRYCFINVVFKEHLRLDVIWVRFMSLNFCCETLLISGRASTKNCSSILGRYSMVHVMLLKIGLCLNLIKRSRLWRSNVTVAIMYRYCCVC